MVIIVVVLATLDYPLRRSFVMRLADDTVAAADNLTKEDNPTSYRLFLLVLPRDERDLKDSSSGRISPIARCYDLVDGRASKHGTMLKEKEPRDLRDYRVTVPTAFPAKCR